MFLHPGSPLAAIPIGVGALIVLAMRASIAARVVRYFIVNEELLVVS